MNVSLYRSITLRSRLVANCRSRCPVRLRAHDGVNTGSCHITLCPRVGILFFFTNSTILSAVAKFSVPGLGSFSGHFISFSNTVTVNLFLNHS
nr:hypothetical protein Iba_chr10aCG4440 [Ipomoea batatas]GMD44845.1 hypothetical protein Iba_chr10dCG4380 [Ipomoea batatas]GMD46484.1 hypothetical protein Iba_chr10eCG3730 [Ipomoea batatas]GMD48057.1 hypothetical protein Iba_chr10fCG2770 [Ipomoea batatas]